MTSKSNFSTKNSPLRTKQNKPKPLQNKASMNQPIWLSHSTDVFKVVSAYTILAGAVFLLMGGVSQDRFITAVGGISTAVGLIGTTVSGGKPDRQLDQENDKPYKMPHEEPQDRLDIQDATVDCLKNSKAQNSKIDLPLDTYSDPLADPLEKLDQAIRSDARNC